MALGESDQRREGGAFYESGRQRLELARPEHGYETGVTPWVSETAAEGEPPGFELDLLQYWHVVWKHRLLFLCAIVGSLAVAIAITVLSTPIYTARVTLQIDREAAKVVNLQDVQPREEVGQSEEFYQTQYGHLVAKLLVASLPNGLSARSAWRARASSSTPPGSSSPPAKPNEPGESARAQFRELVLNRVMTNLGVDPVRGSRLVTLSFDSPDPGMAATVVNSFADSFIKINLERRFESSSYARDFLEQQIALAKIRLEDSERAAVQYAIDQQIINLHDDSSQTGGPSASESLVDRNLSALDTSYAAAQADRIDAESKWRQASAAEGLGLTQVLADPTVQELSQEKAKLEAQYQDEMRLFRPSYPPALQLKAQIDELNQKIESEVSNIKNSLHANYMAALSREQQLEAQVNTLKASELNLKDRSIKYNSLQREADTNRTLYDGLLQRYKEVGVTGGVTANNVSVVDRAEAPLKPSRPKPLLNLAVALVAGLGLGALAVFGAEALDQAIRSPADVEQKLGMPLLGAVPLLTKGVTPEEAMKDPRSSFWEAYFSTRTALQFSSTSGVPPSMVVVSARHVQARAKRRRPRSPWHIRWRGLARRCCSSMAICASHRCTAGSD